MIEYYIFMVVAIVVGSAIWTFLEDDK